MKNYLMKDDVNSVLKRRPSMAMIEHNVAYYGELLRKIADGDITNVPIDTVLQAVTNKNMKAINSNIYKSDFGDNLTPFKAFMKNKSLNLLESVLYVHFLFKTAFAADAKNEESDYTSFEENQEANLVEEQINLAVEVWNNIDFNSEFSKAQSNDDLLEVAYILFTLTSVKSFHRYLTREEADIADKMQLEALNHLVKTVELIDFIEEDTRESILDIINLSNCLIFISENKEILNKKPLFGKKQKQYTAIAKLFKKENKDEVVRAKDLAVANLSEQFYQQAVFIMLAENLYYRTSFNSKSCMRTVFNVFNSLLSKDALSTFDEVMLLNASQFYKTIIEKKDFFNSGQSQYFYIPNLNSITNKDVFINVMSKIWSINKIEWRHFITYLNFNSYNRKCIAFIDKNNILYKSHELFSFLSANSKKVEEEIIDLVLSSSNVTKEEYMIAYNLCNGKVEYAQKYKLFTAIHFGIITENDFNFLLGKTEEWDTLTFKNVPNHYNRSLVINNLIDYVSTYSPEKFEDYLTTLLEHIHYQPVLFIHSFIELFVNDYVYKGNSTDVSIIPGIISFRKYLGDNFNNFVINMYPYYVKCMMEYKMNNFVSSLMEELKFEELYTTLGFSKEEAYEIRKNIYADRKIYDYERYQSEFITEEELIETKLNEIHTSIYEKLKYYSVTNVGQRKYFSEYGHYNSNIKVFCEKLCDLNNYRELFSKYPEHKLVKDIKSMCLNAFEEIIPRFNIPDLNFVLKSSIVLEECFKVKGLMLKVTEELERQYRKDLDY